jgi:O-acetylserine/cysteine efflux transporter
MPMQARHVLAAILVAALWGSSFVAIRLGLDHVPPLLLAALRFGVAALAVLVLPRPAVPLPRLVAVAMALFVGEFGLLFTAMAQGMPPGLASVVIQSQAFFTLTFAAVAARAMPGARQVIGTLLGLGGLAVIAGTVGGDATAAGLILTLGAAAAWAVGNLLLKGAGRVEMLPMIAWMSAVATLPLLALSLLVEGPAAVGAALASMTATGVAAVLWLALPATLLAFAIWGRLLRLYPAGTVAPFSLLVPVFGLASAALVFGEHLGPARLAGMALVGVGLSVVVVPPAWPRLRVGPAAP